VGLPLPLSVSIVSCNEETNLRRCLVSVRGLAGESIVVDSGSSDGTLKVACSFGARVHHQDWMGFRDQKNFALELCTQPWVLALDCDEELSPALRHSIEVFFASGDAERYAGAEMARKVFFMGRWIKHGDWYPDRKLRLFRREAGRWGGSPEHDKVILDGPVARLKGDLLHYSFRDISHYISKINVYSDVFLQRQRDAGQNWSLASNVARPLWRFFRAYFLRLGFLDGFPGFWIAVSTAYFAFVRYSRLFEYNETNNTSNILVSGRRSRTSQE